MYIPEFILVPIEFSINLKFPQNEVPMLLRSGYRDHWSLRPSRIVNVPIFFAFDDQPVDETGAKSIFENNFTKVR